MVKTIDLNADMAEGFGTYEMGQDEALLNVVSSANIACGFHAGDATIMHQVLELASKKKVNVGAHPGFNDLWGFGRRFIEMKASDLEYQVAYQIGALMALAAYSGVKVRHVKPHGALYCMAAERQDYAFAIVQAIKTVDASLLLVGFPNSELEKAAHKRGLTYAREGFCDRAYLDDGSLAPRTDPRAIIKDANQAAAQALRLASEGEVVSLSGKILKQKVETLCIHGDEKDAIEVARAVRTALEGAGIPVAGLAASKPVVP